MLYVKLAWRNVWRNKRRSMITVASIMFSVFFAVFIRALQLGMYDSMTDAVVRSWYGYVQVHAQGYWDEQSLDNTFPRDVATESELLKQSSVAGVVPRLEGFALLTYADKVRGVHLSGINPTAEDEMSELRKRVVSGAYITDSDSAVLVSEGLARYLGIHTGDSLAMVGMGFNASTAAGKYSVKGVVKLASTQANNASVFLPLAAAQSFYGTDNRLTALALLLKPGADATETVQALQHTLDTKKYEVMSWQEMLPELVQMIQVDSAGGQIMVFILYMVISFGIFGTVLMMVAERRYEFGVLLSVGMSRIRLSRILVLESLLISTIGVLSGIVISRPFIHYFHQNPITLTGRAADTLRNFGFDPVMPTLLSLSIPVTHGAAVLTVAVLLSAYSIVSVYKLDPLKASRR
ncbi:MAG: ABC transporter permease [Chlorobi bacterium]|nr:MAG: ABC transporter permease [Bacteroidota bacterium]MBL1161024.1 ABC transporter permease [Chlorobiota bacterium]MBZ0194868.1 ABC transporter permease [Candidatus Kapabacteria bacterium]MCC6331856.1 ABC transporter permease [Ignavibacteria bacterium]MCL4277524.1 ABC transporter permease [Ignavibacteria bacterium]